MFQKTKNKSSIDQLGQTNRIVDQTIIKGNIEAVADLRFDGLLEGNLKVNGKVVIGPLASIQGSIICQNADVEGVVKGTLYVEELLHIKEFARVEGEIVVGKLAVEPGGKLDVSCKMLGDHMAEPSLLTQNATPNVVELVQENKVTTKKKK